MQASVQADVRYLWGWLTNRSSATTTPKAIILAAARYLLAPEDTSPGARPVILPAPLLSAKGHSGF